MKYEDMQKNARLVMAPKCRVCKECNGKACRGELPGVGGAGNGEAFIRNCEYFRNIEIRTDFLHEEADIDTSIELFGNHFSGPVFAAPIAGMAMNYNGYLSESVYYDHLLKGCRDAGTVAFTGDGSPKEFFVSAIPTLEEIKGLGIPTIKPWADQMLYDKLNLAIKVNPIAIAMDIDGARYARVAARYGTAQETKSPGQIKEYTEYVGDIPFIVKGVMSHECARRLMECKVAGIVVSNHGGRTSASCQATMEVLPKIREVVGDSMKIFVDGGIRSGEDIFKALAFGADAVLIGRPYVVAAHGAGREGVEYYTKRLLKELRDVMRFTGCTRLGDITIDYVVDKNR